MTVDEFEQLLPSVVHWHADDDGLDLAVSDVEHLGPSTSQVSQHHVVAAAELAQLHPELPQALKSLSAFCYRSGLSPTMAYTLLKRQVRVLVKPLVVQDLEGQRHLFHSLIHIQNASENGQTDIVVVSGNVFQIATELPSWPGAALSIRPQVAPFVSGISRETVTVSRTWLDTQYPGWWERYLSACALDVVGQARAELVLQRLPAAQSAMNLTGITFI